MATIRAIGLMIGVLVFAVRVHAQDAQVSQVPEPPAAYASAEGSATTTSPPRSDVNAARGPAARRLFNIWFGLGIGDALGCGNEDPDSPCAVDFAATLVLAADYRFVSRFSVGMELGAWSFAVPDTWRGTLPSKPEKADIGLAYLAVFGRWYWFDRGMLDPYVQLGLGLGSLTVSGSTGPNSFRYTASGVVPHLGVGIDFHVGQAFRLGPQLLAAFLRGNKICEQINDGDEVCRDPEKNDKGEQEGNALAWRFMLVGTLMLGRR